MTFGEVIALAGDYYGIPDAPIVSDQVDSGTHQRFKNAYATLAIDPYEGKHKVCGEVYYVSVFEFRHDNRCQ